MSKARPSSCPLLDAGPEDRPVRPTSWTNKTPSPQYETGFSFSSCALAVEPRVFTRFCGSVTVSHPGPALLPRRLVCFCVDEDVSQNIFLWTKMFLETFLCGRRRFRKCFHVDEDVCRNLFVWTKSFVEMSPCGQNVFRTIFLWTDVSTNIFVWTKMFVETFLCG